MASRRRGDPAVHLAVHRPCPTNLRVPERDRDLGPGRAALRIASRQSSVVVWAKVVAAAASIELLQLFVMSRVSDSTDIVLAALGGGLESRSRSECGAAANNPCRRYRVSAAEPGQWVPWIAGLLIWIAVLAVVFWYPFDFDFDAGAIRRRLLALKQVPLYAYWKGSPFRAITECYTRPDYSCHSTDPRWNCGQPASPHTRGRCISLPLRLSPRPRPSSRQCS